MAAAHVSTVQQDAVTWLTVANDAGILHMRLLFRHCAVQPRGFVPQSGKFPPLLLLMPAMPQLVVVASANPQEERCARRGGGYGQHLPPSRGALLLSPQRVKVHDAQEVLAAVGGWPKNQTVIRVQDQLAHPCQNSAHLQEEWEHVLNVPLGPSRSCIVTEETKSQSQTFSIFSVSS